MALETAYISIIIFAGKSKTLIPLTELLNFNPPNLPIGGGTALGCAMNFLMDEIESQVQKSTYEIKGDWKPVIFLITDGSPTDEVASAIQRWNSQFKNKANLVAISIGNQADTSTLTKFTDNVLIFNDTDPKYYSEFFQWVSASIETKSINVVVNGNDDFQLPKLNEKILQKEEVKEKSTGTHDERFAILLSRCKKSKNPYLMKYIKESSQKYVADGAYIITEEYFDLAPKGHHLTVNSQLLNSIIPCPSCGNPGFAQCTCGNLFCFDKTGKHCCPWCGQENYYSIGDFDISKTQG